MNRIVLTFLLIAMMALMATAGECTKHRYGNYRKPDTVVKLADVKASDEIVTTTGMITAVCQSAGCWIMIRDGDRELFVKAKGEKFLMPKNAKGATARVQGKVKEVEMSEELLHHFAEDGLELGEIKGPRKMLIMSATGVEIMPMADQTLESTTHYRCSDAESKREVEKAGKENREGTGESDSCRMQHGH